MNDFVKINKPANIYWLKHPIEELNLSLKIKSQESITLLPKFIEIFSHSDKDHVQNEMQYEEFIFQWQEKVFSQYQFTKFRDIHNCVSERDFAFNQSICQSNKTPQKVFTYINEDYTLPLPIIELKSIGKGFFSSCIEEFILRNPGDNLSKGISLHHLFKSEDDITWKDEFTQMHIFYDNSKYDEDSNSIIQDECLLVSVYHNTKYNYVMISPDINNESNPYGIESSSGYLDIQYFINVDFGKTCCREEMKDLLNKLLKKLEHKQKVLTKFVMPPLGKWKYYISIQLETAKDFDDENIDCESQLNGRTHLTKSLVDKSMQMWAYGHIIEFEVEVSTGIDPLPLKVFFEAISLDIWGRHRTEGYTYLQMPLIPGYHKKQLTCSRPEELNEIDSESRRFFVGGCHLIEDLEILEKPQIYTTNFRFYNTGSITLSWTVLSQSHSTSGHMRMSPIPHTTSSDLIQGADAVLKQYKRAKATLAAATRSLIQTVDSG